MEEKNVVAAFSSYVSSFEKDYSNIVHSCSILEAVQDKLNQLSEESFRQFLKDPKLKFAGAQPNSPYREICVKNVLDEICTNIKYHFQKAVDSHKSRLLHLWTNIDPNLNEELCLKMWEDAKSTILPYIREKFFLDYMEGRTGEGELELYKYIEAQTPLVVAPFFILPTVPSLLLTNLKSPSSNIGRLELPQELTKPLHLTSIPKFDIESSDSRLANTVNLLISILEPIMIPFTIPVLRFVRVWRGINVRIMNYAITLVTYGRYIDHPDFPSALKLSTDSGLIFPPPHWVLIDFFKSARLPYNCSVKTDSNVDKCDDGLTFVMKKNLREAIKTDYENLHHHVLGSLSGVWNVIDRKNKAQERSTAGKTTNNSFKKKTAKKASEKKVSKENISQNSASLQYELEPMNCIVTSETKRPPLFNDLQDWVYKYRYRHTVGVYDEYPFVNRKPNQPLDVEYYKSLAEDGLHCKEVAIMETVLRSDIHTKPPPKTNT